MSPTSSEEQAPRTTAFRLLKIFNRPEYRPHAGSRQRLGVVAAECLEGEGLFARLLRELAAERVLPLKEVCEAFEFFAHARRYLQSPVVADLCSGHGLVGILFAAAERHVERVILCDKRRPPSFDRVRSAALRAAPWIEPKLRTLDGKLADTRTELPREAAIVAVHACGRLTDTCLEIALEARRALAVMPCCRDHSLQEGPRAIARALGGDLAHDIHRTYRLEAAGYFVRWLEIPEVITPMNRVLLALPEATEAQGRAAECAQDR